MLVPSIAFRYSLSCMLLSASFQYRRMPSAGSPAMARSAIVVGVSLTPCTAIDGKQENMDPCLKASLSSARCAAALTCMAAHKRAVRCHLALTLAQALTLGSNLQRSTFAWPRLVQDTRSVGLSVCRSAAAGACSAQRLSWSGLRNRRVKRAAARTSSSSS